MEQLFEQAENLKSDNEMVDMQSYRIELNDSNLLDCCDDLRELEMKLGSGYNPAAFLGSAANSPEYKQEEYPR